MSEHNEIHTATTQQAPSPHQEGGSGGLLEIDGTLLFIAGSFILFTIVMQRVFYSPLLQIRQKREQHINGLKDAADVAVNKSQELEAEYTGKITATRKKVAENTSKAISEANQERIKILEERKQQVQEFLGAERQQIQVEKQESINNLKENIDSYASDIFRKVLEEDIPVRIGD